MDELLFVLSKNTEGLSKEELLKKMDEEVEKFSRYMANLPDSRARGALSNPEKALVKTFMVFMAKRERG